MNYDQHVYHKWHVFVILFYMSCPEPSMGISHVGSFPVQSGGSLINFLALLCVGLALTRETSYIHILVPFRCSWQACGGCKASRNFWLSVIWECPYISHASRRHWGYLYICLSGISLSVSTSIVCQQLYYCRPVIPVDQHHCWSQAVSCMAG